MPCSQGNGVIGNGVIEGNLIVEHGKMQTAKQAKAVLDRASSAADKKRQYFPVAPSKASHNFHTHIQVSGEVTYVKREGDGDLHFTVCEPGTKKFTKAACIVAECIPKLPCEKPRVGQRVSVFGIARFDGEHKWFEVHPVEEWVENKGHQLLP